MHLIPTKALSELKMRGYHARLGRKVKRVGDQSRATNDIQDKRMITVISP